MASSQAPHRTGEAAVERHDDEGQPLLHEGFAPKKVGLLCATTVVVGLALAWCVVDTWNRDVSSQLFNIGSLKKLKVNDASKEVEVNSMRAFEFPLTLAFMQFAFMGLVFLALWWVSANDPRSDYVKARSSLMDKRWGGLVTTHVLSTFWLQALMLPKNTMSLGIFATSRMVEVPTAAVLRGHMMRQRFGGHPLQTIALMSGVAWLMTYAYTQIAECLCIFSGNGVTLIGIPLYLIFGLVVLTPAANAVCQEAVLVQLETPPLLLLAMQNIFACMLFFPVLLLAHIVGWEDVGAALGVTTGAQEVSMLILALCVQMCLISSVTLALISLVDSFWTVALRSLRVAYYWFKMLFFFYFASDTLLSIAQPHQALWSFAMLLGLVLVGVAVVIDQKAQQFPKGKASAMPDAAVKV